MSRAKRKQREFDRSFKDKFADERKPEPIVAKTSKQKEYLYNLYNSYVNISIGPAGTGKTFLPSSLAADMLRECKIERIIVARPYVQTGRSSGLKPGDTASKMFAYVRNVLDTVRKRIGDAAYNIAFKDGLTGQIEICELESIRGRSFDDKCWVILDEMQQSRKDEMIALMTRFGDDCRITICGDINQKDIRGQDGLSWFMDFVERHNLSIPITEFSSDDIVRGGLVKDIVKGLEKDGEFN